MKRNNEKNNIIDLSSVIFPIGSKAWHPSLRVCEVKKILGLHREVKSLKLNILQPEWVYTIVNIKELKSLKHMITGE